MVLFSGEPGPRDKASAVALADGKKRSIKTEEEKRPHQQGKSSLPGYTINISETVVSLQS